MSTVSRHPHIPYAYSLSPLGHTLTATHYRSTTFPDTAHCITMTSIVSIFLGTTTSSITHRRQQRQHPTTRSFPASTPPSVVPPQRRTGMSVDQGGKDSTREDRRARSDLPSRPLHTPFYPYPHLRARTSALAQSEIRPLTYPAPAPSWHNCHFRHLLACSSVDRKYYFPFTARLL